ncbi:hypothetical protein L9G74_18160 [Shewanella sp. C32]|uniref:Phage-related membrane protein n=1 Tax=Shewanella electrica TaxID=515560 RepID=A0ABT2FPW6_9GAMM|nr:hypothetical protein [Shewanella electrica]MCH1926804.1 hypothetical protein [Shewanella electrica]MCS4558365.1 hypothetical protein [Shewanella electrica]
MIFKDLTSLYKKVSQLEGRRGSFFVSDQENLELLQSAINEEDESGVKLNGPFDLGEVKIGSTVKLELGDPRIGLGLLADDLDGVLSYPKSRVKPVNYYLIDHSWSSDDEDPPVVVQRYHTVLRLIEQLKEVAAYLDKSSAPPQLVFIHSGKFTLPINYKCSDLNAVDVDSVEKLLAFFSNDLHREQKQKIFEKVICEQVVNTAENERFPKILAEIEDILKKLNDGYTLFAADFSYDKVVNQLEVAKLEELAKVNKVFSDIQNQILGIPVATVIVATQLKSTVLFNDVFWINTAVLVGVWVFVILVNFVLRNQLNTLSAIDIETKRKQRQIEREFQTVKSIVEDTFKLIDSRIKLQRLALKAVDCIASVGFILAHFVYFALTEPAMNWLMRAVNVACGYWLELC